MAIAPYKDTHPQIDASVFIAPSADIIGDVHIGSESGIWYGCVVRGDVEKVRIGARTNIQDGTIIHVSRHHGPTIIGDGVTVGHKALLHACTLQDGCFVGMGATVMDYAVVETGAMVGAGALLTPNKVVKSGQLWLGSPARYARDLTDKEKEAIAISEHNYVQLAAEYRE